MTQPNSEPPREDDRDIVADYRAKEREQREIGQWQRMSSAGIEFGVALAAFGLAGWGIDKWLGISPWGLIAGVGLGFAVGLYILVRMANRAFK
jgi:F0F1-type ATP synthase assembly protein I